MSKARWISVALLACVFVLGTVAFFTIDSGAGYRGPRVDCDGHYFWLNLRSIVVDGDIDFENDFREYGNPWQIPATAQGKVVNPVPVGSALLWSPFYLAARGVLKLAAARGALVRLDGMSRLEELVTLFSSFLYGFAALLLAFLVARRHFDEGPALLGAVGAAVGGTLLFYMVVQPSYAHAPSAFTVAAFVACWDRTRAKRTIGGWALLGALGGLVLLVRPEHVAIAVLPLADLLRAAGSLRGQGAGRWRALLRLAVGVGAAVAAALAAFAPQLVIWKLSYGSYTTIPQGESFMQWGGSLWLEVLFHPRAGLVPWMPLALPALLGLGLLARRDRWLGIPLVICFALMTYINGAVWDWWGGYSFGARRFVGLYIILALGLAAFLQAVWAFAERRARALALTAIGLGVLGFCLLNVRLMGQLRFAGVDWYSQRPFHRAYFSAAARLGDDVHRQVGNPLSWPANLLFALRHGTSPADYDDVAGRYLLGEGNSYIHPYSQKVSDELHLARTSTRPFLVDGFGSPLTVEGRQAVGVVGERACLLLPMLRQPDIAIELSLRAARPPLHLAARFNGHDLGSRLVGGGWQRVVFPVPGRHIRRGVNELCVQHEPRGPQAPRALEIGRTGTRSPVDLALYGAGFEDGNRSEIWIGGRQVGQGMRGMNVAALDPRTGAVLSVDFFDLCFWPESSTLLSRWVERQPRGTIVLLAVQDDASRRFSREAKRALEAIGAAQDLRGRTRHGYVAVGVRGARPGTALEDLALHRPAVAVVGAKPAAWTPRVAYDRLQLSVTKPEPRR